MEPSEIKAELILRNISGVDIAKDAGCTKQYVSAIIKKKRENVKIQTIIAQKIGKTFSEVWAEEKE